MTNNLNHFDSDGNARMVDVGGKNITRRTATARGVVRMKRATADQIQSNTIQKGDVLGVARIAGITGTKWTPHLIPMCHPIAVDSVDIHFDIREFDSDFSEIEVTAVVNTTGRTGVEMEAMTAVTTAALTIYDMCKSIDREMEFREVHLTEKTGGNSGHFVRSNRAGKE